MTEEMLAKIEERRRWKNIRTEEGRRVYKRLNNELQRKLKRESEWWLDEIYEE